MFCYIKVKVLLLSKYLYVNQRVLDCVSKIFKTKVID